MIACPLCMQKLPSYRPAKWDPYYRCPCGTLFHIRFRRALPHFITIGLRKCDPIRLPPPQQYFAYRFLLKNLFRSLRGGCRDTHRELALSYLPMCDLIRFGDQHFAPIRNQVGEILVDPEKCEFLVPEDGPPASRWPVIGDFEELHTNCDFASWCLERIGDGRFSENEACAFGYIYQHFPHVNAFFGSGNKEIAAAWKKATKGQLPSSRRAQVRSRLTW